MAKITYYQRDEEEENEEETLGADVEDVLDAPLDED